MIRAKSFVICSTVLFIFALGNIRCSREGEKPMEKKTIEQVLKTHTDHLMSIPGVVGTGIGEFEGKPCIMVFVVKKTQEIEQKIPSVLEGYKVVIEETGEIRAFPEKRH